MDDELPKIIDDLQPSAAPLMPHRRAIDEHTAAKGTLAMQDQFRSIYGAMYSAFSVGPGQPQFRDIEKIVANGAGAIAQSIDQVQERLREYGLPPLREDAKFLLLTCFTQMIYAPLTMERRQDVGSITAIIIDDIWTIATSAAQGNPTGGQISAHTVLNTLPTVWDRIKAGASRLWEGEG